MYSRRHSKAEVMWNKFKNTCVAWYIVAYPPITVLLVIIDKVLGPNPSQPISVTYSVFVLLSATLLDMGVMLVVGAMLYLIKEYSSSGDY